MKRFPTAIRSELIWIVGLLAISFSINYILFSYFTTSHVLSIQLHDTYFVISSSMGFWNILLILSFFTYLFRGILKRFNLPLANIILFITCLGILLLTISGRKNSTIFLPPVEGQSILPLTITLRLILITIAIRTWSF